MSQRVVISGLSVVSSLGDDIESLWENCLEGKSNIEEIPENWREFFNPKSRFFSRLDLPDYKKRGLSNSMLNRTDPSTLNALVCTNDALKDANLKIIDKAKEGKYIQGYYPDELGVFIGVGSGGISSFIKNYRTQSLEKIKTILSSSSLNTKNIEELLVSDKKFNPFSVSMFMPNSCAANIGIHYNLRGACNTYPYACAASTISIGEAYEAIKTEKVQCAIAGGTEYIKDPVGAIFRGFDNVGTLTQKNNRNNCNSPFDISRSGFLFNEGGAAILVLENYQSAVRRDAKIYAEIKAFQRSFEAYNTMRMNPTGSDIKNMLDHLLSQANIGAHDVDYINAHGTGTVVNDQVEAQVIEDIFGRKIPVNSTKSILGHTLGASGAIETVITALSIKNSLIHPSLNIVNPIKPLNFPLQKTELKIKNAITQSFAFGGHNAALILSSLDA